MQEKLRKHYEDKFSDFLTSKEAKKLLDRLERICYKIAPIKVQTGNTQTIYRWELTAENPHYATDDTCQAIFEQLASDLIGYLQNNDQLDEDLITIEGVKQALSNSSRIGSLELPVTYRSFRVSPIHSLDNLFWFKPPAHRYLLEQWLNNKTIMTKIQVKSFLTDRRQTGDFQTNREVRWETHPRSPQFSARMDCLKIQDKLIAQITTFDNAPDPSEELITVLETVLGEPFVKNSFRCPISGKSVEYDDFVTKISSPIHGRSGFQVGHLNPLASTGGHEVNNISWITDLGNRVQGDSSLNEIVNEIFFMANFHKHRLGLDWAKIEDGLH